MEKNEMERNGNNQVILCGEITSPFKFSHKMYGEGFYTAVLAAERLSKQKDLVPIMVPERLIDVEKDWTGKFVKVLGQFRSYHKHDTTKNRLVLTVFVREFEELEDAGTAMPVYENWISLNGFICKSPAYRRTPFGREIADILLAVNRAYGNSDYIPCITWGRNARYSGELEVGTRLQVEGRIQSREYQKRISDDEFETRTAYEVSITSMEVLKNE